MSQDKKQDALKELQERLCWAEYELDRFYQSLSSPPSSSNKKEKKN